MFLLMEELCRQYEVQESHVRHNFKQFSKDILKNYNIKLTKIGRGKNIYFLEEYINEWTGEPWNGYIWDKNKDEIIFSDKTLSLPLTNLDFTVFLALLFAPMNAIATSYEGLAYYLEMPITEESVLKLRASLKNLEKNQIIMLQHDSLKENVDELPEEEKEFFIAVLRAGITMNASIKFDKEKIQVCKQLAQQYRKRSFIPMLKVWLGIEHLKEKQPFTITQLQEITGLSLYNIRESIKILENSNIFLRTRAYANYMRCLGSEYDMTAPAFYKLGDRTDSKN